MKINDWIKYWNYVLFIPCAIALGKAGSIAQIFWLLCHMDPVTLFDNVWIGALCLLIVLALGHPFIATIYTAIKMISLAKTDNFSSKFC